MAERERESKRDRSARQRADDDGAQAVKRKRAKREQLAEQALPVVSCALFVKPQYALIPRKTTYYPATGSLCNAESAAAAERDWQERVREGRFVVFGVKPSNVLRNARISGSAATAMRDWARAAQRLAKHNII